MDFVYRAHIQLAGTRPRRLGLFFVIAWAVFLAVAVFAPSLLTHLAWIPSERWLAVPGPLFTPFVWGTEAHVNVVGLILSTISLWVFGGRLHNRLGTPRLTGFLIMGLVPALVTWVLLSLRFRTGVVMLGPALAVMVLLATAKVSDDLPILYKNYLVGNTRYLAYGAYGITGVGLLVSLTSATEATLFASMAASLVGVHFFFDRRFPATIFARLSPSRRRPKLWGMRGGRWGQH